ncbi:MAG TPA: M23 family metallopeptidase [candidate division WOR-3 bacterium]|uniref:M23 family metallopeptidase n=1 Tax=candidate division WOR-3 bacterium TaxID=2052148 RepID=A0A7C0VA87_UNCW3|nr:M23 family metallopeptidase [candidate division WOR-3 bacterium]
MRKKIVFHIIPESGRVVEFSISYRMLRFLGVIAILVLGGIVYMGFQYGRVYAVYGKYRLLQNENKRLKEEVKKIKVLEKKLREFEILSRKLASALGVERSPDWEKTLKKVAVEVNTTGEAQSNRDEVEELRRYIPDMYPVRGGWISKGYSDKHPAIDISAPPGTPVYSPMDGVVTFSGYDKYFGYMLRIENKQGFTALLGHNKQNLVGAGRRVRKGEMVALLGSTGHSTAPHLHYELMMHGRHVDPLNYLPERR